MTSLFVGVGLLVLAVRLGMVWYSTNPIRTGPSPAGHGLMVLGLVWALIGFIMGFVDGWVEGWSSEGFAKAWAPSGGVVMLLGCTWILQGRVNIDRGRNRSVVIGGALLTAVVGIILVLVHYLN